MVSPVRHAVHDVGEVCLALRGAVPCNREHQHDQRSHSVHTCATLQDLLDVTEAKTGRGHVLGYAAVREVVIDRSLSGVVPNVDGVLGDGLLLLVLLLCVITGHHWGHQSIAQDLQLVETSGDLLGVELTDVHPGVLDREVLDEEDVHLAAGLVNHGDPLVAGDPGRVGREYLGPDLVPTVLLPHEREIVLVLDHAGQQGVVPLNLDQRSGETVTQGGNFLSMEEMYGLAEDQDQEGGHHG